MEHGIEGATGGIGVKINDNQKSGGERQTHVDARELARGLLINQMGGVLRSMADFGMPTPLLLDCILQASAYHYAMGLLDLAHGEQKQLPEDAPYKMIDGIGEAVVDETRRAYDELLPQFKEEMAKDDRANSG